MKTKLFSQSPLCWRVSARRHTFAFCKKLKSIYVPDGVSVIPSYAFFCCESLTELRLPKRLEGLGSEAFTFCPLKTFRIPSGVTMLDYTVLANTPVSEIIIPEGVTEINNSAFYQNENNDNPWGNSSFLLHLGLC